MPREVDVFGLLMPAIVPLFFLGLFLSWQADRLMRHFKIYRLVAWPAVFRLAVFAIIFSLMGIWVYC